MENQPANLLAISQLWLEGHITTLSAENTEQLRQVIRFHEHRYYILNDPLINDEAYDRLFAQLVAIELQHPEWITTSSPSQRVGSTLNDGFVAVNHLVPMLSLENSYNEADLLDWDRKVRDMANIDTIIYGVEPKFDGASISVLYENDQLVRSATRGDGVMGDDITANSRQIRNLPLTAPFSTYGIASIEIRGEVLMSKKSFEQYNQKLAEQGQTPLANPRNAAAGSLRMKDPAEVGRRQLEAFLYHISYFTLLPEPAEKALPTTHSEMLQMLWDCGCRSPLKEMTLAIGATEMVHACVDFEAKRDLLPYEIDGMVVKVNDLQLQEALGMTSHHPRWAIAFKFKARQATTVLRQVDFQVGRTGAITPVAKTDPVSIGGVTVTSISIHNEEYIKEKDLQLGDTVVVERAGDVIPQIATVVPSFRNGQQQPILFPTHCPVCQSQLYKEEGEAVWRCINSECPAQVVEKIIHFVSKDAMDIKSFGEQQVRKFYEKGWLKDIPGIYQLPYTQIGQLEGFGKKSLDNLKEAIEQSKKQPLHRIIYGLGIRHVGETTAKALAQLLPTIFDLSQYSIEALQAVSDIGPKVAGSIFRFFHNSENIAMLHALAEAGLQMERPQAIAPVGGKWMGMSFLFTGTLVALKRSEAEAMVEAAGGKIASGVSSKLNYLVVGEEAGSKLEKAKKIPTIRILTEQDFLQMQTTD